MLKRPSVAFSATPLARRDSLVAQIFTGSQPQKMATHPCAAPRLLKNVFFSSLPVSCRARIDTIADGSWQAESRSEEGAMRFHRDRRRTKIPTPTPSAQRVAAQRHRPGCRSYRPAPIRLATIILILTRQNTSSGAPNCLAVQRSRGTKCPRNRHLRFPRLYATRVLPRQRPWQSGGRRTTIPSLR
jgi:hypothetical protein